MDSTPSARMACSRPAGIHSARPGGTTQIPLSVSTVMTPAMAWTSWIRAWAWRSIRVPAG